MVAKSYQGLEILDEPHSKIAKGASKSTLYVTVRTKAGSTKEVRWYSETEYARMYKEEAVDYSKRNMRNILGFGNAGYVTIFKGDISEDNDYFNLCAARYTTRWGWYFPSDIALPDDLPENAVPVKLEWSAVGNEDGSLKSVNEIKEAIEALIYDNDPSEFQGNIGDHITRTITVEKAIPLDGYYGPTTMYIMYDELHNCYIWTTAARTWETGTTHTITGTVKDHKVYHNVHQTIMTRCREVS